MSFSLQKQITSTKRNQKSWRFDGFFEQAKPQLSNVEVEIRMIPSLLFFKP